MRAGGCAEWLFQPADQADLCHFLQELSPEIPIFVLGVGSNILIRDRGVRGVVIRLGRPFFSIDHDGCFLHLGAATLLSRSAVTAAEIGLDLTFLRTIPGTIGGGARMNAGCYGSYFKDNFKEATVISRQGEVRTISAKDMNFGYRKSAIHHDEIIINVVMQCQRNETEILTMKMDRFIEQRNLTQPVKVRTAGSTFRNPLGRSSTLNGDEPDDMKAWKLIDDAGMRGFRIGDAQISQKHSNFMINIGTATASDIETLGETVREKVFKNSGIWLEWEIERIGENPVLLDRKIINGTIEDLIH